jgi:hypothetical protein
LDEKYQDPTAVGIFTNTSLSRGLVEVRQGCRRKSYSGNRSLSQDLSDAMDTARAAFPMVNVTLTHKIIIHPLDKIFGGIPAGPRDVSRLE